ncbi:MAG: ribosome maturation factor RimP [Acidimicrobiales bacterium]
MGQSELVRELVEPLLASTDLELVDVEIQGPILRLSLDRPGGIDLEAIARISPVITAALDESDPMPDSYQLEISSPGLERPLRTPEHFARFIGSKISVRTLPGTPGERRLTGLLTGADPDGVEVDAEGAGPTRIGYGQIERARTVFEWGPAPKPGKAGGGPARKKKTSASKTPDVHEEATPR